MLYESYIHPVTILSTLPFAGVGALLALILCRIEFSVIALIGIHQFIKRIDNSAGAAIWLRPQKRSFKNPIHAEVGVDGRGGAHAMRDLVEGVDATFALLY